MLEIRRTVTESDLLGHPYLFGHLCLESLGIGHFRRLAVHHVEQRGAGQFRCSESLVEFSGIGNLLYEIIRNNLPCLVVLRVGLQHLRFECPVFVDLRTHLDIVTVHIGSGQRFVRSGSKHSLQRMTEFVEHSLHLVYSQQ